MQEFLIHTLGFSADAATKFETDGGTVETLMRMTKDTCPSVHMWTRLNQNRDELYRLKLVCSLQKWADKWKARNFLKKATTRELRWTLDENPYYPCVAYGVSFDACSDLGVPCPDDSKRAHAWVCDVIRKGNGEAYEEEIEQKWKGVDLLSVCPIDLTTHPLWGKDSTKTPRSELVKLAGLDGVGEFQRATNDLYKTPDGKYKRGKNNKSEAAELAGYIREMLNS